MKLVITYYTIESIFRNAFGFYQIIFRATKKVFTVFLGLLTTASAAKEGLESHLSLMEVAVWGANT